MTPTVECGVSHNDDGDGVLLLFSGSPQIVEKDGELVPVIELTAGTALRLAEALVACAGEIVNGLADDREAEDEEC